MEKLKFTTYDNNQINWRNFKGTKSQYNPKGERKFVIFLDEDTANQWKALGWNVKWPKDIEDMDPENDNRNPYLEVGVRLDKYPARLYLAKSDDPTLTGTRITDLTSIGDLDEDEFAQVDLIIRGYEWDVSGKQGVKAYLEAGKFTLLVDVF